MSRETLRLGLNDYISEEFAGRPIKSREDIKNLAEKVIDLLRPEKLPVCQVKDVLEAAAQLADMQPVI